jgi:hypothetical protein
MGESKVQLIALVFELAKNVCSCNSAGERQNYFFYRLCWLVLLSSGGKGEEKHGAEWGPADCSSVEVSQNHLLLQ